MTHCIFIEEGKGVGQFAIIDEYFITTKQLIALDLPLKTWLGSYYSGTAIEQV